MDCHAQSTNVLWQNANHERQRHYDNTITADENVIQKVKKKYNKQRRTFQKRNTSHSFVFCLPDPNYKVFQSFVVVPTTISPK